MIFTCITQGWVCTLQNSEFSFNFSFVTTHTTLSLFHKSFEQFENFRSKQTHTSKAQVYRLSRKQNSQIHTSKAQVSRLSQTHTHPYTLGCLVLQWQIFSTGTNRGPNSFEPHFWSLYEFDTLLTHFVISSCPVSGSTPCFDKTIGFLCHVWMTLQVTLLLCFYCCWPWYLRSNIRAKTSRPWQTTLSQSLGKIYIKLKIPHVHNFMKVGSFFQA
jgi:hypothetical protein